jgi:hypothetical protein
VKNVNVKTQMCTAPNQQLHKVVALRQADRMSVGAFYIALRGLYHFESLSMNLFRFQHVENYQRGSLVPIHLAARTIMVC